MNGLELSKGYYDDYGKPMLEKEFRELLPFLAIGFVGSGSEHYGFDDEISRDHDFEPGFCVFLPEEKVVDRRQAFLLERAYAKLPKEYRGFQRQRMSPVGGNRNGILRTSEFYEAKVGVPDGVLSTKDWLRIPDYALAEAVNGEIFVDEYGEFSRIRELLKQMPEDIRLKRIAGNLLLMAQSGQYNFSRCIHHGEPEAAQLCIHEFVQAALRIAFLLNGHYAPFYKWSFRALRVREHRETLADDLSFLLWGDHRDIGTAPGKADRIEKIASDLITELQEKKMTQVDCGNLEKHAYSVNDMIRDAEIRNLHILAGV